MKRSSYLCLVLCIMSCNRPAAVTVEGPRLLPPVESTTDIRVRSDVSTKPIIITVRQ
jgi:hypothetical protein